MTLIQIIPPLLTISLFFILMILQHTYWLYLWQLKEYRLDRMRDWLGTVSGRRAVWNTTTRLTLLAIVTVLMFYLPWLLNVILLLLTLEWNRKRVLPIWTTKAMIIFSASSLTTFAIATFGLWWWESLLPLTMLLLLMPLVVALWVAILSPITRWQKQRLIRAAKQRISSLHPIVIGITGSYGKSTTKEFLRTILEPHFRVLSTPKNINVDVGVAQVLLSELTADHEICIIEMGAYRTGEIASICDLVSPSIGILTAIAPQHLALFGSMAAIADAKSELLQALPSTGHAIINGDQDACHRVADRSQAPVIFYSTTGQADVWADQIVASQHTIEFELHIGNNRAVVGAALHGEQVVGSMLAAAAAAAAVGLTIEQIAAGLCNATAPNGTMALLTSPTGVTIIDDHYNSNPDAFMAALDYLSLFTEQKKIVITPGMIELGVESTTQHEAVGGQIARLADLLIITKPDFAQPLKAGALRGGMPESAIIINDKPEEIIERCLTQLTQADVVLLEGRVHQRLVDFLTPNT